MSDKQAKQIILDLLDAANDGALASCQDGGANVDVVFSRMKGHENEVMSLSESERRMDRAIRRACRALTGKKIEGDPIAWVNS